MSCSSSALSIIITCTMVTGIQLQAVVFDLDFDNHVANTQPNTQISGTGTAYDGLTGMLFTDVAVLEDGSPVNISNRMDMVFEAITPYNGNTNLNGALGSDIRWNQNFDTSTTYRLSFYNSNNGQLFTSNNDFTFSIAVIDIDGGYVDGDPFETVSILTPGAFELTTNTIVTNAGGGTFTSSNGGGSVTNPTGTSLSAAQEDASVVFTFTNQSQIEIEFGVDNSGNTNQTGRNLYIDGRGGSTFDDSEVGGNGQIPEPQSYALITGITCLAVLLGRRKQYCRST